MNLLCLLFGHSFQVAEDIVEVDRPIQTAHMECTLTADDYRALLTLEERTVKGLYCPHCGQVRSFPA